MTNEFQRGLNELREAWEDYGMADDSTLTARGLLVKHMLLAIVNHREQEFVDVLRAAQL